MEFTVALLREAASRAVNCTPATSGVDVPDVLRSFTAIPKSYRVGQERGEGASLIETPDPSFTNYIFTEQ